MKKATKKEMNDAMYSAYLHILNARNSQENLEYQWYCLQEAIKELRKSLRKQNNWDW